MSEAVATTSFQATVSIAVTYSKVAAALQHLKAACLADTTLFVKAIDDASGRLRMWGKNLGAHRVGRVSLDYRLREASRLQKAIVDLLEDVATSADAAFKIVTEGTKVSDDVESLSFSESSDEEDEIFTTSEYVKQQLERIAEIITCLFELTMTIKNAPPRDRFGKAASIDVSHFEAWDIAHVRAKFPKATETLASRLGQANCKRRQLLGYMEKHHKTIGRHFNGIGRHFDESESEYATTMAKTQTTVYTHREVASIGEDLDVEGDMFSEISSLASSLNTGMDDLRVPSPPRGAMDGKEFECPYCFDIMKIDNYSQWRGHVFRDLQPYICTSEMCITPMKLYGTRREWLNHEAQHQREEWTCNTCLEKFESPTSFKEHVQELHNISIADCDINTLLSLSGGPHANFVMKECPLCDRIGNVSGKHLTRHLQTLALFILPQEPDNEEDHDLSDNKIESELGALSNESNVSKEDITEEDISGEDVSKEQVLTEDILNEDMPIQDEPITFQDAVGRRFMFPWKDCRTWDGMRNLIQQVYLSNDNIGEHVHAGRYDLIGPNGYNILPEAWEETVRPGWGIKMQIWWINELTEKVENLIGAPPPLPPLGPATTIDTASSTTKPSHRSEIFDANFKQTSSKPSSITSQPSEVGTFVPESLVHAIPEKIITNMGMNEDETEKEKAIREYKDQQTEDDKLISDYLSKKVDREARESGTHSIEENSPRESSALEQILEETRKRLALDKIAEEAAIEEWKRKEEALKTIEPGEHKKEELGTEQRRKHLNMIEDETEKDKAIRDYIDEQTKADKLISDYLSKKPERESEKPTEESLARESSVLKQILERTRSRRARDIVAEEAAIQEWERKKEALRRTEEEEYKREELRTEQLIRQKITREYAGEESRGEEHRGEELERRKFERRKFEREKFEREKFELENLRREEYAREDRREEERRLESQQEGRSGEAKPERRRRKGKPAERFPVNPSRD